MKQVKWVPFLMFFALSQLCWGCSPTNSSTIPLSATPENSAVVIQKTSSPRLSNTLTPIPTVTLTPVLTMTPLSQQDAYQVLQKLYWDNGGCQLPCYWGVVPGETLWQDTSALLSPLGRIYGPSGTSKVSRYGVTFEKFDEPFGSMGPGFWVENEVVKVIGINSSWVSQDFDYSLSGLLQSLGVPDEIWISPIAESLDGQPYYHLELFYPSKGILVGLLGNAKQDGQYLSLCPQKIFSRSPFPPTLLLWNPKEPVHFDSNFGKRLVDDDLGIIVDDYRLLQGVSPDGLTNAQFYDIYSDPETEVCIKVSPVR